MMHAGGNSAIFMMENMMHENPEMMTQVMDNFMDDDFDIFFHMEESTYDPEMDQAYDPEYMEAMQDFQADIIGTMMDYGGEDAMESMAYMMSTGDDENSTFILEAMLEHERMMAEAEMDLYSDPGFEEQNLTLALLDEMSAIDPNSLYERSG